MLSHEHGLSVALGKRLELTCTDQQEK